MRKTQCGKVLLAYGYKLLGNWTFSQFPRYAWAFDADFHYERQCCSKCVLHQQFLFLEYDWCTRQLYTGIALEVVYGVAVKSTERKCDVCLREFFFNLLSFKGTMHGTLFFIGCLYSVRVIYVAILWSVDLRVAQSIIFFFLLHGLLIQCCVI